jgi:hypothetical protein
MTQTAIDTLIEESARCYGYQTRMDTLLREIAPGRSMTDAADPNDPVLERGSAQGKRDAEAAYRAGTTGTEVQ